MIIDGHRHLAGPPEKLIEEMDSLGIDRTVLVGIGVKDLRFISVRWSPVFRSHLLTWIMGTIKAKWVALQLKQKKQLLETPTNDAVLEAIKLYPDRFSGFAFINPADPAAITEAKRCLDNGMIGLKFALLQYPAPIAGPMMMKLCRAAEEYNVPVFIHIGPFHSTYCFEKLVKNYPNVPFIIAHAGAQHFWRSIWKGRKLKNVYYDLSSYYVTLRKMRILAKTIGPERLLFGSDAPVMADSPENAMGMIASLGLNAEQNAAILGENLKRILKLS